MARDEAYRRAEQKIEEARRSGAKELDLSQEWDAKDSERLTQLPDSLGQLTQLQSLDLSKNQLTALPESLGQLTQLQSLNLSGNQLATLPEWLGQLTHLQSLSLSGNQLATLPEWLGQFTQLQSLNLSGNQLATLPEWLGQLTRLLSLDLSGNQLTTLPESLARLQLLKRVNLFSNKFQSLPDWFSHLSALEELAVGNNPIHTFRDSLSKCRQIVWLDLGDRAGGCPLGKLPEFIRYLDKLRHLIAADCDLRTLPLWLANMNINDLDLEDNPLSPDLAAAYKEGLGAVKRYLRELAKGARNRYEAKLLILGDGNEGKTCASRALRGLPFRVQRTTHGVDVEQWKFPHPDDPENVEKEITLNIWDFEGQEISHQTHQFFLTSQSLYLLVFKCRDLFLMDRAEYWLDTIRARAPKAKAAIVITQCEERTPLVPLDRIKAQYGDLLAEEWFFAVGCETGLNVERLQTFLERWAAALEFMGSPWPISYDKSEIAVRNKAKRGTAHIGRDKLNTVFKKAGVDDSGYENAAAALSRLGVITQFPDCPDLRDFVVLRPQWLTKAISRVMEDKKLAEDKGEIPLKRMGQIWDKAGYRGMFATFHTCMKEFELCYDLEDASESCLVPLRFGYVRPPIPWSDNFPVKERRVEYKLNIRPPMGIMSRFIVKTHHMIVKTPEQPKGVYWHNGVFLRTGEGSFRSEALCEFEPEERRLRIEVRAAYPQNMCEQIHAYVKAVFSFFSGLEAERSYGCIKVGADSGAETRCSGVHTEKRIYTAISKQRPTLDCEFEEHEVDPRLLVWGFGSFSEFIMTKMDLRAELRQELDKRPTWAEPFMRGVEELFEWVKVNNGKMDQMLRGQTTLSAEFKQEAELKLHEYLVLTSQMLDDRDHTAAPGLISVTANDRSKWNPKGYFKKTYILTPYCEWKGNIHACEDGCLPFTRNREWWEKGAPYIAQATRFLAAGLQLAFAGMPLALGNELFDVMKNDVGFMKELTKHMELKQERRDAAGIDEVMQGDVGKDLRGSDRESRLTRAALAKLLEETAPVNYRARQWGSLRRVRMSDESYRWLCEDCAKRAR